MKIPGSSYHKQEALGLSTQAVKGLLQTKGDFLAGKTTARPWENIKKELLQHTTSRR